MMMVVSFLFYCFVVTATTTRVKLVNNCVKCFVDFISDYNDLNNNNSNNNNSHVKIGFMDDVTLSGELPTVERDIITITSKVEIFDILGRIPTPLWRLR